METLEPPVTHHAVGSRRVVACLLIATFALSALLIFVRLGHYALWEDEAGTALGTKSVLQCGDTQAWLGRNLVAYRGGILLHNLRTEGEPPFCAYFDAPFMKLLGENALGARLPFALCGWATVGLLCWWVWRWRASTLTASLFCLALLGNVSFFLYARQCHYYAPATLFFCLIAYLYLHWEGGRRKLALLSLCAALLLSLNYSFYIVLALCLGVDYLVWQRKVQRLRWADWAILILPSLAVGLVILAWWNPFRTGLSQDLYKNTLSDRLTLFWWAWRDLNRSEMIVLPLLLATVWAAFVSETAWLKRGLLAFVVFVAAETAISSQPRSETSVANVRYFCVLLPLAIALGVFTLRELAARLRWPGWAVLGLGLLLFWSNLFNGGLFFRGGLRCTPWCFARELAQPPPEPYTAAIEAVRRLVPEGSTLWVTPNSMLSSMMFHVPQVTYAWVLEAQPRGQFASVPGLYFVKKTAPDYVLAFGPVIKDTMAVLDELPGVFYEPVTVLNVFWRDLYRPELLWRLFDPVTNFDPEINGIQLLKKSELPPPLKVDDAPAPATSVP
ncbi:MAG: ArnT family glycosyltransferase [Chthoniobacteraceae bacterium]